MPSKFKYKQIHDQMYNTFKWKKGYPDSWQNTIFKKPQNTECSKSHCAKVWAYCSAPSYLICKMFQKSNSFEEYTMLSEIGVQFFEWMFIFYVFRPLAMAGSHPLWATFVWPIEIRDASKNQSSSMSSFRDIYINWCVHHSLCGGPWLGQGTRSHAARCR